MPNEKQRYSAIPLQSWRTACICSGRSDVDGGYALVVLASSFVVIGLPLFRRKLGLLVPNILNYLGARYTIMLGGLISSAGLVLTAFAHDIWVALFTYGFLLEVLFPCAGCCLSFCGSLEALSMYFSIRLRLATGFATCGSGIGLFLIGPLLKWFNEYYGWRGLLFINASVTLQMMLCGALVFPKEESKQENVVQMNVAKKEHLMTYREHLVDKRALCLCFVSFLQGMSILFVFIVLKDLLEYFGQGDSYTLCLMVIGISSTAFRIISSALTEFVSPLFVHAALLAVVAIGQFLLITPNMGEVFYVAIAAMLGIGQAIYTTIPLAVANIFGRAEMAPTYAILQVYAGIGTIIGPAVGGYIWDVTGSYNGGMILGGAILVLASAASIGLEVFERRREMELEAPLQENPIILPLK